MFARVRVCVCVCVRGCVGECNIRTQVRVKTRSDKVHVIATLINEAYTLVDVHKRTV